MAWFYLFIYFGVPICSQSLAINISGLLTSLTDIQELLNAYDKKDYVATAIKIVDLKLKLDPPEENSIDEKQLLRLKSSLFKLHPYSLKIQKQVFNMKQMVHSMKGNIDKRQSKKIESLIKYLDRIKSSVDNVVETLKANLQPPVGTNKNDENINYSGTTKPEAKKNDKEEKENYEEEDDQIVENTNENKIPKK